MTEHKKLQPEIRFAGFTDDWEQCKLGSILKVKSGMSQKGIEVPNGQYPILATGGEIGRTNTAIYDKESVLIGRKGTIDKPYYMNSPFWTVDTLFYTELSVNIFALFIYYLFQKIGWKSYDTSTGVPSFTDAWEQRKLGEVVNVLDNLRIPIAASQRLEGVTPYYGANGIQGYIDGFTHDGEFVLVAEDGANDLINYPVQYVSGKVWINNHAHVLQGIKNVANNLFLVYRIKSMDMTKYLVGGGRTKLNASVMKDIELHLPNYAEQTQIGNFFKQLDDTIALHQREVEKYKKIKQSYLEKMFI
ncbi:restriction endonuclease subunit S [Haemophilus parahaemolyticus]|uniref:restriction endonuclease subunit S n=1 Tax=Haemophilus parahaemolyticus TaxID=735 RepID=UPI0028E1B3F9|nr:restriction endonuclease subunit S [Haemophilus parahaemolyticus]